MGNSNDEHVIRLDRVKDAVRENAGEAAANVFDRVLDTDDEAQIQTGLLLCIVNGRPRRILRAPPGGTHTSSTERAPHTRERLVAGNRLNQPLPDFVATPLGLGSPKLVKSVGLGSI